VKIQLLQRLDHFKWLVTFFFLGESVSKNKATHGQRQLDFI
jgi:hypothetical protein